MYCMGLRPGILCGKDKDDPSGFRGAYWEEFKKFFRETLNNQCFKKESIRILIQTKDYLKNAPFRVVGNALKADGTKDKILVRLISDEWKKNIEKSLGEGNDNFKYNYNFAVFDDKYFRLEYEANSYRALGSFRSDQLRDRLSKLFNDAFNAAEDITNEVRELDSIEANLL